MSATTKTALAASPSMCRHCAKSATKLLVWQDPLVRVDVYEGEFCAEHFGSMIASMNNGTWDWENL